MSSPYSQTEISQTGDPTMGQVGAQNTNVNDNLYAASYSNAPGRAADASTTGGGSDLATQGLMRLQQGDQYGGIMTLLDAAQKSPQSVQSPEFLQQLQIVESQSATASGAQTESAQFTPPAESPAYGSTGDTTALSAQQGGTGQGDVNSVALQALQVAQSNPTEGILGLMQASTMNPDLMNDQNFLTTMSEVLPQGPGAAQAQAQPGADGTQSQQVQQPADASQYQQPLNDGSQQQQVQQPVDASQYQQPTNDGSQQQQVQQPVDASQYQQPTNDGSQQQQVQQPADATGYAMPAQLTSSGNPQIEAGVKQAFQLIQAGDQFDGARLLMMIAKADPSILQDQAFVKNLTDLENAVKSGAATSTSDQTAQSQTQQQYDANGNPVDAQGNPIAMTDANGNPIAQPGAQQMTDASGNPIAQPGAQQITDASGNPIAQPGAQQITDASGNPIAQPGAQQMMTDASGNPVATDAQGMPLTQPNPQAMTGMPGPTDTQTQASVNMDPSSIGAPAA